MPSLRSRLIQTAIRELKDALLSNVPVQKRRLQFEEATRRGIRIPRGVVFKPVSAYGVPAEWIIPINLDTQKNILYLHGGGYITGSINTHRGLAARIALAAQSSILIINYRLAPEFPFPAALEDATTAYRWLLKNKVDPKFVAIAGDSAGGGLALATTLSLRDNQEPLPAALILISPWLDLTNSGDSITSRAERDPLLSLPINGMENPYAGDYPLTHPLISPLFGDFQGFPPIYIQVGSEEILFDDSSRLETKLNAAGVINWFEVWDGMWHVFQGFAPLIPEAQLAITRIGVFLNGYLKGGI